MKTNVSKSSAPFPFCWLDTPFGTALLAIIWSFSNPFGDDHVMD